MLSNVNEKTVHTRLRPSLDEAPPSVVAPFVMAPAGKQPITQHWPLIYRENLPLLVVVCVYVNANLLTRMLLGLPNGSTSLVQLSGNLINVLGVGFLSCFIVFQFGLRVFRYRGLADSIRQAWREVCRLYCTFDRIVGYVVVWFLLTPFLSAAVSFREMIPKLHPFAWDKWMIETGLILHCGYHLWTLLQPLLGHPIITWGIDRCYFAWLFFLLVFPFGLALSVHRRLRFQYILSFLLVWILLGTIGATFFSSAGPCFYAFLEHGENPYASLFTYLDSVHQQYFLWSRYEQLGMWQAYLHSVPFGGITAMPSLHVAGATLFALAAREINRWLGILFTGYAVVIQFGSVHLGWHYSLDGYISVTLTLMIWRLVGWGITVTDWV